MKARFNKPLAFGLASFMLCANIAWAQQPPAPIRVTLLHLNDVYQISPVDNGQRGGLARVATLIKQAEAQNPNTFVVLAGDTLSPSIASRFFQGKQMIDVWNQLGLDIAVPGNHEFDFGDTVLLQRMQESKFTWVNANVIDKTTGKPFGNSQPYVIKEINGVKIGFFGLLTPDTVHAAHPGPNVEFKNPIYTACETVSQMRKEGANVIIAVTHLALNQDKEMAQRMPYRMALILGGHEHSMLQSIASGIPIYKMGSDARTLGRMELWINAETKQLESIDYEAIPVTAEIAEDPAIAASVKGYEDKLDAELGQTIGETAVALDARQVSSRSQETNLGNFIADAYRNRVKSDVALINGGSIRSNTTYNPGPLTRKDVYTILPFGNPVVKVEISGKKLKAALENSVSHLGQEEAGRFPQVSGLKFTYDPAKPVGSRVTSVLINNQPLNDNKNYTLATTSYLVEGGDDYRMLQGAKPIIGVESAPLDADVVLDAITQAKTMSPKTEGRIKRLGGTTPGGGI